MQVLYQVELIWTDPEHPSSEQLVDVCRESGAGLGVDKADGEGGAAAADPEEGVLEGRAPGRGEEGRGVVRGEGAAVSGVGFEVLEDLGDEGR